ncbi:MAG: pyrroloquinoline quinone biosynthesis protein B [Paraglaciecola sp.]|jgi:pyrroloquinoline quinone biosynthesis protein B|uniref:MBL fold metallo-hydrolase n=1 Tax=Polaribacter sp. TaxID=1920175 RepID=UPI003AD1A77B
MKINFILLILSLFFVSCNAKIQDKKIDYQQYITILGIAQDGGYPHIGCQKQCCADFYNGNLPKKSVVSLGLVDIEHQQKWLFDATPDMHTQLAELQQKHIKKETLIDGIFLTHAHIGHYTGLMYFGREAYGKKNISVFAMPKMKEFLTNNGPWSQLVSLQNIVLKNLQHDSTIILNNKLKVTPFLVPHRDEFSETVGYKIEGTKNTALFIPDIDKWHKWKKNIIEEVKKVEYAFVDATFLDQNEVKRAMTEVPHPFIKETINLFKDESLATKNKVIFIHFNHTNPALQKDSKERKEIEKLGFRFANEGANFEL